MPEDKRHLQWNGNQWRVRIKVRSKLVDTIGETVLIHPLYVTNLTAANLLKGEHVSRFKARSFEPGELLRV